MTHGYIYNKTLNNITKIEVPYETKLNNLLYDGISDYTSGYDGNKIHLFNSYKSDANEFELTNNELNGTILLSKVSFELDKAFFCYLYNDNNNEKYIYIIKKSLENEDIIITENKYKLQYQNDILKYEFFYIENNMYFIYINKNENNIYVNSVNMDTCEEINTKIDIENIDENYINFVYNKIHTNTDETIEDSIIDEYKYKISKFPIFFSVVNTSESVLCFINLDKSYIYKKVTLEKDCYKNIKKCLITNESGHTILEIYNLEDSNIVKTSFHMDPMNLYDNIHIKDTDLIVDMGEETNDEHLGSVSIKPYQPSGHYPNEPKFFSKKIKVDTVNSTSIKENKNVEMNSIDDLNTRTETAYNNELNIIKDDYAATSNENLDVIENSQLIENVDNFTNDDRLTKYDELQYNENVFVQEFSKDNVSLVAGSIKQNNGLRNINEVTSNKYDASNNVAIGVNGTNNNEISEDLREFKNEDINSLSVPVSEFNEVIFPFINIAFRKFGNFSYQQEDMDIIYPKFDNYVIFAKRAKNESERYNNKFGNERINQIIDYVYDNCKVNESKYISKNQIARFVNDFFSSKGKSISYHGDESSTTGNIFKYVNKYDGYEIN